MGHRAVPPGAKILGQPCKGGNRHHDARSGTGPPCIHMYHFVPVNN